MVPGIGHTIRDRLTLRHILPYAAFLALFYGVTRNTNTLIAVTIALGLAEGIDILQETPSVNNRWVQAGIGVFVSVASLAWLAFELAASTTSSPVWFPAVTFLAGVWFLLDARSGIPKERVSPDDKMGANEVMLVINHWHLIVDELKSGPKSVPELAEQCGLTESRVRGSLDLATDDGMVYRTDDRSPTDDVQYALDESKVGGIAFIRSNGKRLIRRLLRPLRR